MLEAIDLLKGVRFFRQTPVNNLTLDNQVLGFEEAPSTKISPSIYGRKTSSSLPPLHSRAQSQPLFSHQKPFQDASNVQPKRARAPSDPFLDASQTHSILSSPPSANNESLLATAIEVEEPTSPVVSHGDHPIPLTHDDTMYDDADEQYLRVWTSPDLANPEILQLVKLFPAFISRRPLPRFPPNSGHADIEEGDDDGLEGRQIQFGTGSMCVSSKQRTDAWEGGWWTRFIMWWKRIFC
jgi:hypothetical protein